MAETLRKGLLAGLGAEAIRVQVPAADWREAVLEAGALLAELGIAEPRYGPAMVATAERLGPYIVIAPGLAMPHSRPEDGALRSGICLLTLRDPVDFGNPANDPVQVVLGLAGADPDEHVAALAELAPILKRIYDTPEGLTLLTSAQRSREVLAVLERMHGDAQVKGER